MSELEKALDRLSGAVARLAEGGGQNQARAQIAELTAERDRLKAELATLKASRDDDARLRAEAASAVRDALRDLRGLVASNGQGSRGESHG